MYSCAVSQIDSKIYFRIVSPRHNGLSIPSLSLKQDVIEKALLGELKPSRSMYMKKYRREYKEKRSIYAKRYLKKMKEKMLKNSVEEKCDHCDYKTINHLYMTDHKRINHSDTKQHCSECDYSHYYLNRVRQHFKRVHLGIKRNMHRTTTCRRKWCEHFGKTNCTELTNHSLFFCEQCQLTFDRSDTLKYHNEKIHEGVVYNCEFCKEYSNSRKYNLERHILSNHTDDKPKPKTKFCIEEGCTYRSRNATELRQHVESKHEGVIRFKCNVTNCNFGSITQKDLRRHTETHTHAEFQCSLAKRREKRRKKREGTCTLEGCNEKIKNMIDLKRHIAVAHKGRTKYVCKFESCKFEALEKKYVMKHNQRCSFRDKRFTISSKPESLTTQTLSREKSENFSDKAPRVESENEISPMVLCSFPGCAFFAEKVSESQQRDHLRLNHSNSEWTETSFITINSAMSEAMELLQGIKEEKNAVLT